MNSKQSKSEIYDGHLDAILQNPLPAHRLPYYDRMAWLMACVSDLAYLRFNPLFPSELASNLFNEHVAKMLKQKKADKLFQLIRTIAYDPDQEKQKLVSELGQIQMSLVRTFDNEGTQAILVAFGDKLVLGFRGTEATSVKDIKADLGAKNVPCESGGKIHSGFQTAYYQVASEIEAELKKPDNAKKPLLITGHSLGGALATIAAKVIKHDGGVAACYTFGAPRVGDDDWVANMRSPVYRVVNAADCVTMLPPNDTFVKPLAWMVKLVPAMGKKWRASLLSSFSGYIHGGNMRYLTNCKKNEYDSVKLLYSVSLVYRLKGMLNKGVPWRRFVSDHSIAVYRKKLAEIARRKNPLP